MEPVEAAIEIVQKLFPTCQGALLAGSIVRGDATHKSDLDIIVFDVAIENSYRESFFANGWPVELFVHNLTSYKPFFQDDCKRGRPSLPNMVTEGIVLKGDEFIKLVKTEAQQLLNAGPEKWSEKTINIKRYFITDALDDFEGTQLREEEIFIANNLAELVNEFYLRTNGQWIGNSKWVVRALRKYDESFTEQFVQAFDVFYKTGEKEKIMHLVDDVLKPFGGRLFEGFSIGK
ncbi:MULTISPECIES: nucleotidyltransferase domain-containing protein [Bacillus]|uniref:nucleotidyltransferase domain-containing protein n=1 Tax=Bacillus TaxID=1386 RepID=UPI000BB8D40B|nr:MULTISPECIES: nucleotidyltransferase domain-containing protein [Bacillus]